jgi:DNA-binding CsgD family transcriptional regulator
MLLGRTMADFATHVGSRAPEDYRYARDEQIASWSSDALAAGLLQRFCLNIKCRLVAAWHLEEDFCHVVRSEISAEESDKYLAELRRTSWDASAYHGTEASRWLSVPGGGTMLLTVDDLTDKFGLAFAFEDFPRPDELERTLLVCHLVAPIIRGLVEIKRENLSCQDKLESMEVILSELSFGIGIVSRSKIVEFCNAHLHDILIRHDGLRLANGCLSTNSIKNTVRLHVMIDHIIDQYEHDDRGSTEMEEVLILSLERSIKTRRLTIVGLPLKKTSARNTPAALLFVADSEGDIGRALIPVCRLNNLTPVETRLACYLASGKNISETCVSMNIKEQTGRAYLRQIFQKTGTNRQVDLVRMLITNLLPIDLASRLYSVI